MNLPCLPDNALCKKKKKKEKNKTITYNSLVDIVLQKIPSIHGKFSAK